MYGYQAAPVFGFPGFSGISANYAVPATLPVIAGGPVCLAAVGEAYVTSTSFAQPPASSLPMPNENFIIKRSFVQKGVRVGLGLTLDVNLMVNSKCILLILVKTKTITQILDIAKGGPCDGKDMLKDDRLTHVDHIILERKALEEISNLVLGEEGSKATLTVIRGYLAYRSIVFDSHIYNEIYSISCRVNFTIKPSTTLTFLCSVSF